MVLRRWSRAQVLVGDDGSDGGRRALDRAITDDISAREGAALREAGCDVLA